MNRSLQQRESAIALCSVGRQRQPEVDAARIEPSRIVSAAVETDKSIRFGRSETEHVHRDLAAVRELDHADRLLEPEVATDKEEARDIKIEVTGRSREIPRRARHVERDRTAGAGRHFLRHRGEVDDVLADGRMIEGDAEVRAGRNDARQADELGGTSIGLQRRPSSIGTRLIGTQHESQINTRESQSNRVVRAAAVTDKRRRVTRAEQELIDTDRRSVRQRHIATTLFKRGVAGELDEATDVDVQGTRHPSQFP